MFLLKNVFVRNNKNNREFSFKFGEDLMMFLPVYNIIYPNISNLKCDNFYFVKH